MIPADLAQARVIIAAAIETRRQLPPSQRHIIGASGRFGGRGRFTCPFCGRGFRLLGPFEVHADKCTGGRRRR